MTTANRTSVISQRLNSTVAVDIVEQLFYIINVS